VRAAFGLGLALILAMVGSGCGRVGLDPGTGAAGIDVTGSGAAGTTGRVPALHRPGGAVCPPRDLSDDLCAFPTRNPDAPDACLSNADCVENGRSGYCTNTPGMTACQCSYDFCTSDSECQGGACLCGSVFVGNVCAGGGCGVDADCGVGGYCSPNTPACGGLGDFQCHTPRDQCVDDTDCSPPFFCGFDATLKAWRCQAHALCIP
jgi:hypothetical protein